MKKNFGFVMVVGLFAAAASMADSTEKRENYVGVDGQGRACTVEVYSFGGQVQDILINQGSCSYDPNTSWFFTCGHVRSLDNDQVSIRRWEGEDMEMWYEESSLKYSDASKTQLVSASARQSSRANKLTPWIACLSLLATKFDYTCTITGPAPGNQ